MFTEMFTEKERKFLAVRLVDEERPLQDEAERLVRAGKFTTLEEGLLFLDYLIAEQTGLLDALRGIESEVRFEG